ncbi:MORC family CW-type zinc finger protein 4 [Pteronotus mesoamericanus]|uniref:MORC family CW-type zinc finger protein 4 n=1 Tax=Pteronotus mesoamericanus TaxID=1884717 RepID=UPI0023EB3479|nr:MORC family CW-type zinc finger protein 4 [Pteronotus parnellii mesoamericanus]
MLLYRGAPAGPGAPGSGLARQGSGPQAFGIRLSTMSPRYLQSNSSSHTRPFSAIAELLDNAVDPDVSARTLFIDVEEVKNKFCLTFTDDGCGMTPHKLHRMLSFGFTDKVIKKSQCPIGVFGNGFKSGSMRLGKDALVFTKNGGTLTVGLLSQTYLECVQAQAVIVPIVPFNQQNKKMIITEDSLPSLEAILNYSIFNNENELLSQFDAIPGKKGTRIIIWNIRRNKDGKSELDFDTDQYDILVSDFGTEEKETGGVTSELPETEYSLRAFCGILYMKPRMKIFLRQKKVTTQMIAKSLANVAYDIYKPTFTNKQVKITFGFSCKNNNQFGVMMYHNNRLIKSFEKVGCQVKPTHGEGVGVIGVIECNFLKPAYNKQDFEYTKEYRLTINALAQKLNAYWKEKTSQENFETPAIARTIPEHCWNCTMEYDSRSRKPGISEKRKIPDQTWVQCDECLKWRKLPGKVDPSTLPARWFCYYNSHPKYRRCSVPEEQELIDEDLYLNKAKKQDQTIEKRKVPMENENHQVFTNPLKNPTIQDMDELNNKTIGYEEIDRPSQLPSVGEESRTPVFQLKPLDSSVFQFSSKYKWILGDEPVEKQRRLQNEMTPLDYSMPGSYRRVEAAVAYPEGEHNHDKSSSERSTPPYLSPEYPEANKNTSQSREVSVLYSEAQEQHQGSLLPEELEDQMPRLVAEDSNRGGTNISKEDVNKGLFVAVVGVAKGVRDSGAPIQLIPFNREELAEKRKAVESWNPVPYPSVASSTTPAITPAEKGRGYEESGSCHVPKMKNQRQLEELKRTTEKLEHVLAERNLFQQKVEELEQERNHWHSEFKKVQHELVTYSTQETEGLYWSKKHMGYRQAEFQILKAELERTKEEKQELKEKLRETEMHLEVLQKAQVSYRTPEGDDLERALAKLTRLRIHVSYLLTSVLPHLELREIGFDSEQVDGILYTVLEANHILD